MQATAMATVLVVPSQVLGEAGRHDEAIGAARRAVQLGRTFHSRYQLAETHLTAKRCAEAPAPAAAPISLRSRFDLDCAPLTSPHATPP